MTAHVIPRHPAVSMSPGLVPPVVPASRPRPVRSARRPAVPVLDGPVSVERDDGRGLHVAICGRCCESFDALRLDQADTWADTHRCDPELAALLADLTGSTAA